MKKRMLRASTLRSLPDNSRFWILTTGIVLSILATGFIQLYVPSGSLQTIRIEQWHGFVAMFLLYAALIISPLTKVFPRIPYIQHYIHARRALGVLAFYYAFVHVYITFFKQLDGFAGIAYYNTAYKESLFLGIAALAILGIMTATSLDWIVTKMRFKNWKLLHRTAYVAVIAIMLHVILLGPHYLHFSLLGCITYVAVGVLVLLEIFRIRHVVLGHARSAYKKERI